MTNGLQVVAATIQCRDCGLDMVAKPASNRDPDTMVFIHAKTVSCENTGRRWTVNFAGATFQEIP